MLVSIPDFLALSFYLSICVLALFSGQLALSPLLSIFALMPHLVSFALRFSSKHLALSLVLSIFVLSRLSSIFFLCSFF